MKTIDLATETTSVEAIFHIAEQEHVFVRTSNGKTFIVTEVEPRAEEDDFAQEVALTRQNVALQALLAERSEETATHTLDQVRQKLGLLPSEG